MPLCGEAPFIARPLIVKKHPVLNSGIQSLVIIQLIVKMIQRREAPSLWKVQEKQISLIAFLNRIWLAAGTVTLLVVRCHCNTGSLIMGVMYCLIDACLSIM